jgi:hypothetical protein
MFGLENILEEDNESDISVISNPLHRAQIKTLRSAEKSFSDLNSLMGG